MTIQQKLDSFSMVLADHIRSNDQMIKQFEQLQTEVKEMQQQPVTTNWYDFTEEQMEHLGEIVREFVGELVSNLGRTDVHLRENGVEVSVEIDLEDIVNNELPYAIDDKFTNYLNNEITEQRENQQQDC